MALDGVIFDLDGTLIDSNATHVEAWRQVLHARDYDIAADRIFVEVGKGGEKLVPALIGEQAARKDGKALRDAQPKAFARLATSNGLDVFPRVRELLAAVRQRGLKTVIATSSGQDQIRAIEEASGLTLNDHVDAVTTADDIDQTKPAPDPIRAAAKKIELHPAQCVVIGDTPWDAHAARRAGAVCLGLLCGGNDDDTLRSAGARGVWRDPADLLDHLDEVLTLASPATVHLTAQVIDDLMQQALAVARAGLEDGAIPIGGIVARGDGTIIARNVNRTVETHGRLDHAEMLALSAASRQVSRAARDLILVSTVEPCIMCTAAAMLGGVDTILFGLPAPSNGGSERITPPTTPDAVMPRIVGSIRADESRQLLEQWLRQHPQSPQAAGLHALIMAE